jgi:hypothetical protein
MKARTRRFWIGFGLVLVVLVAGFGIANLLIPHWGSTPAEQAQVLPGDEIFARPVLKWEHAITINAKPEAVWPWIVQMGDTRGGYYSYRFIEKGVTAMAGVDVSSYYNNTNHIAPEWQAPSAGQGMIMDVLVLRDVKANQYMVAGPKPGADQAGLLWTWYLAPTADGNTRLLVHMAIQIPGMEGNRIVETASTLATFMMERRMMEGIKLRAEGGMEADWVQVTEAIIWLLTLGLGLVAARQYMTRSNWQLPLGIGLVAILALFAWTYLQPALWLRMLVDLGMIGGLVWETRKVEILQVNPALIGGGTADD